jgi:hypothetical protein
MTSVPRQSDGRSASIDHLVYATADLDTGMNEIEALLGVRPVIGGRHPDFGTHNALLSLGPKTYLEVIAPDPDTQEPDRGRLLGVSDKQQSRLATWVLRCEPIGEMVDVAVIAGVGLGSVETGSRQAPDGALLTWQLTDPYALPFHGAVPFLIDWGSTPHPATTAPSGGGLIDFRIEHPHANEIRRALAVIGSNVDVQQSDEFRLIAKIKTKRRIVELS